MNTFCPAGRPSKWLIALGALSMASSVACAQSSPATCPADKTGLRLPAGFCATLFADAIGHARHMVVAPNGVVYVNTWSGKYFGKGALPPGGFLVALQDTTGAGKADVVQRFGETLKDGGAGGTGIGLYKGSLYAEINDRIVRYALTPGSIVPRDPPQTVVSGLPMGGDHPMHPFAIDADGMMYVDVATATNSCQLANRKPGSPGAVPCTELETRGGIWRFDANKTGQAYTPAARFATGIRNGEGFGVDTAGHHLFVTQHGRDQLHTNWPALYKPDEEATLPAEELLNLTQSGDYGWPECYFDPFQGKLVLAPEYGGNGGKKLGPCGSKIAPIAAFPAHWAPDGMTFDEKGQFPGRYHHGVSIAFHGSWNRAPYPQSGYNVVFQPLSGDKAAGRCEVFADGFAGAEKSPGTAAHRPTGIATGPDGSLYVSDDVGGRIYKIVYLGGASGDAGITPCPSATAAASDMSVVGTAAADDHHAAAAAPATAGLPVAKGATAEMVSLGDKIYHGQIGGAACSGCHGAGATGTALGPNLTGPTWLWSDGSYAGIAKTITAGVMQPKQYRSPMPPMGGAQLTSDQVSAVAAYIWGLSHRGN
jgi:glucose/arabinose dehydrogenase/mono/diheme cytochrome c family protein